jgi:hypothetical protein
VGRPVSPILSHSANPCRTLFSLCRSAPHPLLFLWLAPRRPRPRSRYLAALPSRALPPVQIIRERRKTTRLVQSCSDALVALLVVAAVNARVAAAEHFFSPLFPMLSPIISKPLTTLCDSCSFEELHLVGLG